MATEISLYCCIVGLNTLARFPVDIPSSQTVGHLKRTIKKEMGHALSHIDAYQLEIRKVNDPVSSVPAITDASRRDAT